MRTPETHPVSAVLEAALISEMSRHPIQVWLDKDNRYAAFVDDLRARTKPRFPAPVLVHRDSYLALMIELEVAASGVQKSPLVVHVPYANEESVKHTPLLEIYVNGFRFRRSVARLVKEAAAGRVPPDEVDALLAGEGLTLEDADAWLAQRLDRSADKLAATLQSLSLTALIDDLRRHGPVTQSANTLAGRTTLARHLAAHVGLPSDWGYPTSPRAGEPPKIEAFGDALSSFCLCVEFVHDLKRAPVAKTLAGLGDLSPPLRDAALAIARHLRRADAASYTALANDVARMIDDERQAGGPEDLGKIDTFRFEEEKLYQGALDALLAGRFGEAGEWAHDRLAGESIWLEQDPARKAAWLLVRDAAALGAAVASSPLDYTAAPSLTEATSRYAEHGAAVDRLHRHLEQSREARLYSRVPSFEALRAALDATRDSYWAWADRMARDWSSLCEREGALPSRDGQQRRIFEDVVRPLLADDDKTVLFLVDALRFEMAEELLAQIGRPTRTHVRLAARLAELPSVTEVGMNALAPVAEGDKLRPVLDKKGRRFIGFQTATFRVSSPETRKKAIFHRAGGHACPWHELGDLLAMSATDLRTSLRQSRLSIVHAIEIDAAGEKGAGLSVFGGVIRKLRKAYKLLREAGVRRFVITSDHGFVLRRPTDATVTHGQGYDAMPRYALYENVQPADRLSVPLASLGYLDVDKSLIFPRGLEVFSSGEARTYVHGGNSPQERIIPVLTLEHKLASGSDDLRYLVEIAKTKEEGELCTIEGKVAFDRGQTGLAFTEASHIELDLRVFDEPDVRAHLLGASGSGRLRDGVLEAEVGNTFILLFRLTGPRPARVRVELFHPSGTHAVEIARPSERFAVTVDRANSSAPPAEDDPADASGELSPAPADDWLAAYEDEGVRRVFAHIEAYGAINETEVTAMLGGPRQLRKFSRQFETYAKRAPFVARIEAVGVSKRYVKVSQR